MEEESKTKQVSSRKPTGKLLTHPISDHHLHPAKRHHLHLDFKRGLAYVVRRNAKNRMAYAVGLLVVDGFSGWVLCSASCRLRVDVRCEDG